MNSPYSGMGSALPSVGDMVQITKLAFRVSGTYDRMYLRPFESVGGTLNPIELMRERVTSPNGAVTLELNPTKIAGLAGTLIKPSATVTDEVMIANGWSTQRLVFMMEVVVKSNLNPGQMIVEIISGYTDHCGVSTSSGVLDPNMKMYFNSAITVRYSEQLVNGVRTPYSYVIDTSHVLTSPEICDIPKAPGQNFGAPLGGGMQPLPGHSYSNRLPTTIMPPDLMSHLMINGSVSNLGVIDTSASFASMPVKKAPRKHEIAANYLSETVNNLISTMSNIENDQSQYSCDIEQIASQARDGLGDPTFNKDTFVGILAGNTNYRFNRFITWAEFCRTFREADSVAKVAIPRNAAEQSAAQTGRYEHHHGATAEAQIATSLAHTVPSVMSEMKLAQVRFNATNAVIGGGYAIDIIHAAGISSSLDLSQYLKMFIDKMRMIVLPEVTLNNNVELSVRMSADFFGDTFVTVRYNAGPEIEYCYPTYCDAMTSQLMCGSQSHVSQLSHDMYKISNHLQTTAAQQRYDQATYIHQNPYNGNVATDIDV